MGHKRGHGGGRGRGGHNNRGFGGLNPGHDNRRSDYDDVRSSGYDDRSQPQDRNLDAPRSYDNRSQAPERPDYCDKPADPRYFASDRPPPRLRISFIWIVAALVIWTAGAFGLYSVADPILAWIAANSGALVDTGKAASSLAGGEAAAAGAVLKAVDVNSFVGQAIALVSAIAKPAIVLVWLVGAISLLAAPLILSRFAGRLGGRRRH